MSRSPQKFSIARLLRGLGKSGARGVSTRAWPDKITIEIKGEPVTLATARIIIVEAKGDYLSYVTADKSYRHHGKLGLLEKELSPAIFLRVHRSAIVNKKKIARVARLGDGRFNFHMSNDQVVASSQKYEEAIGKALPDLN